MESPRALVTGITGQDGIYLARHLLAEGWQVVGTCSPGSTGVARAARYVPGARVVPVDLRDGAAMAALLDAEEPDHVYNLAALTSVGRSWSEPDDTAATNGAAVVALLEATVRLRDRVGRDVRFFQASSAEVGGTAADSPYARAKAEAEQAVVARRETDGLFACFAVLHNHESPLRSTAFVTRKITRGAARIAVGTERELVLGNLDVSRDWGFAGEYVDAMHRMLGTDAPVDLPIGTGVAHTLGDLIVAAFAAVGIVDPWPHVRQDPALLRPADTAHIVADPEPAAAALGWRASVGFGELVEHMAQVDLARARSGVEDDADYLLPSAPVRGQ